ncbi:MAG: carbohydrate kinase family protein [Nakamurella multipartita]
MATVGPDVVVVGNAGVDTNVYLPAGAALADLVRTEGHFASDLDYVGHPGAFTSRGFARLGLRTAFVGHVGADPLGQWVRAELAADGIDLTGVGVDPAGTARSVNLMSADGSRVNFYDGRGHQDLRVDPVAAAPWFAGARLALFHLPNWARHLVPVARAAGAVVACDLQDVHDPDEPYRRDFVRGADILFASAAHHDDPVPMLARLLAGGAGLVVCGRGRRGVLVASARGVESFPPPELDLPIVDTNGAGDALAVGFLAAHVLQGRPIAAAVRRGQLAARWACAQRASSSAPIDPAQLEEMLARLAGRAAAGAPPGADGRVPGRTG